MAKRLPTNPPHDSPLVRKVRDKLNEPGTWDEIVDTAIEDAKTGSSTARKFLAEIAIPPLDMVSAADLERIIRLRREAEQLIGIGGPAEEATDPNWEKFDEDPGAFLEAARKSREGGGSA